MPRDYSELCGEYPAYASVDTLSYKQYMYSEILYNHETSAYP